MPRPCVVYDYYQPFFSWGGVCPELSRGGRQQSYRFTGFLKTFENFSIQNLSVKSKYVLHFIVWQHPDLNSNKKILTFSNAKKVELWQFDV